MIDPADRMKVRPAGSFFVWEDIALKILFMGTPEFSVPVLRALLGAGHEITAVVTQPDREKGRGKAVQMSPVKEEALRFGIPVLQPERVRRPEAVEELKRYPSDLGVVVAFGQILPQEVLDLPRLGCVNVHASLLPLYRGASPIQQALLDGRTETGVTIMRMDAGLDTGDILLQRSIPIAPGETGGSLHDKLSELGAALIVPAVLGLSLGMLEGRAQEGETCYAGMIRKEAGGIDWSQPAEAIERKIRALSPWPSAYTVRSGKLLKIWKAETVREKAPLALPGTVTQADRESFTVCCGEGSLRVLSVQPEGRKRMETDAYLRGTPLEPGEVLGRLPEEGENAR